MITCEKITAVSESEYFFPFLFFFFISTCHIFYVLYCTTLGLLNLEMFCLIFLASHLVQDHLQLYVSMLMAHYIIVILSQCTLDRSCQRKKCSLIEPNRIPPRKGAHIDVKRENSYT